MVRYLPGGLSGGGDRRLRQADSELCPEEGEEKDKEAAFAGKK